MNKKAFHINPIALLLLIIYSISVTPPLIKHHHVEINFETATACEKAIYTSVKTACSHDSHLSKPIEKCKLCDYHNPIFYCNTEQAVCFLDQAFHSKYILQNVQIRVLESDSFSNKGPPALV